MTIQEKIRDWHLWTYPSRFRSVEMDAELEKMMGSFQTVNACDVPSQLASFALALIERLDAYQLTAGDACVLYRQACKRLMDQLIIVEEIVKDSPILRLFHAYCFYELADIEGIDQYRRLIFDIELLSRAILNREELVLDFVSGKIPSTYQWEYVNVCAKLKDERLLPYLNELLAHPHDSHALYMILTAIGSIGQKESIPQIKKYLYCEGSRRSAINALKDIGGETALRVLKEFCDANKEPLNDVDEATLQVAIVKLEEGVDGLLRESKFGKSERIQFFATQELIGIEEAQVLKYLESLLNDERVQRGTLHFDGRPLKSYPYREMAYLAFQDTYKMEYVIRVLGEGILEKMRRTIWEEFDDKTEDEEA